MAEAQKLKLKVLWLKNVLGLAIDQTVIKQSYPLTQYYFWPRTEAWDQLKLELDSKPWLSDKEKISTLIMYCSTHPPSKTLFHGKIRKDKDR